MTFYTKILTDIPAQRSLSIEGCGIKRDSNGRFCLNDLHRASGEEPRHKPENWLALDQTSAIVEEIYNCSKINNPPMHTSAGQNGGTYVAKVLAYYYAMWISQTFWIKVFRAFDVLVTGQSTTTLQINSNLLLEEGQKFQQKLQAHIDALENCSKELTEEVHQANVQYETAGISADLVGNQELYSLSEVVKILNTSWPELTLEDLTSILCQEGYLTRDKRVTQKGLDECWFEFGQPTNYGRQEAKIKLRDQFALGAKRGRLGRKSSETTHSENDTVAYRYADAMLLEGEK